MRKPYAAALALLLSSAAFGSGTVGFAFLQVPTGARAVAMGGAFTAILDDPMSLYWNPAGIAGLSRQELTTTYTNYMMDMQAGFAGWANPRETDAIGASVNYFNYGSFQETTMENPTGTGVEFTPSSVALAGTYARSLNPELAVGITGRFVYSSIHTYSGNAFVIDAGALYYPSSFQNLTLGISLRNAGIQTKAFYKENDPLPTEVAAGASMYFLEGSLLVAADLCYPFNGDFNVAAGIEYAPLDMLSLRAGGNLHDKDAADEAGGGFVDAMAFGVGTHWDCFSLDYAYKPFADLGTAHRISLGVGL